MEIPSFSQRTGLGPVRKSYRLMSLRNGILIRIRKKNIRIGNKLDCVEGVSLEEIQRRFFEKYAFCFACLGYRDKAFSLILLVLPYTILPQALNCLLVSPYMKMLRHYLHIGWYRGGRGRANAHFCSRLSGVALPVAAPPPGGRSAAA